MSGLFLLAIGSLAPGHLPAPTPPAPPAPLPLPLTQTTPEAAETLSPRTVTAIAPPQRQWSERGLFSSTANRGQPARTLLAASPDFNPDFNQFSEAGPASGPQLYQQRLAALRAGRLYTRLPRSSFRDAWIDAEDQPSYEQWQGLLAKEARAVANGQGENRLSVVVGDSLSLWLPSEGLPNDQLWLNQGISGDTTAGILDRLSAFANTRPSTIYVMAGINDLRHGSSDATILSNMRQIMQQLRENHPNAQIVIQSILPTRYEAIPGSRIQHLNQELATIADQEGVQFMELGVLFSDAEGKLRRELTTDGLHLNPLGYRVWQLALRGEFIG